MPAFTRAAGGSIPDFSGGSPGILTTDIVVTDSFSITDVNITLTNLTHTWIGDLIASIQKIGGPSVDLFNRVGNGGASSNLGGDYSFDDAATGNLWATAAGLSSTQTIPSGAYYPTTGGGALSFLSAFNGLDAAGTWRLTISDNAGGDTGALGGWTLNLVPEPATLALFALGGLLLSRRRSFFREG